jgi:hydroxyethylthiazole kinase-like uncharacterized protein yjeF
VQSSAGFERGAGSVYADFDPNWMLLLPKPTVADDKYSRGVVGFVTGSEQYPGAALLGVTAASRAGVGLIRLASDPEAARLVLQIRPEIVLAAADIDSGSVPRTGAWVLGSGVADEAHAQRRRILSVLDSEPVSSNATPVVLDAFAAKREFLGRAEVTVLTPHAGEAVRLLAEFGIEASRSEIESDPAGFATKLAGLASSVVVLKGSRTVFASADGGPLWQAPAAPATLSTAGTGDVLAGLMGALIAKSPKRVFEASCLAVWLHSQAAFELDSAGHWAASDLAQQLAITVANAEEGRYLA